MTYDEYLSQKSCSHSNDKLYYMYIKKLLIKDIQFV